MKQCPHCAEEIQDAAVKCKHCGERLGAEMPSHAVRAQTSGGQPVAQNNSDARDSTPRKRKRSTASTILMWLFAMLGVAAFAVPVFLFYATGNVIAAVVAIAIILLCLVLTPVAWSVGDKFRDFVVPDFFLASGAIDMFKKRLFWMFGPQVVSLYVMWGGAFLGLYYGAAYFGTDMTQLVDAKRAASVTSQSATTPAVVTGTGALAANPATSADPQPGAAPLVASCSEQSVEGAAGVTETCLFKDFKSVATCPPDAKGRCDAWTHELFKKSNGAFVKVSNAALFNQDQGRLLATINQRIKTDYTTFSTDPNSKECFVGHTLRDFTMDELGIGFDDKSITFSVTFGLPGACTAVGGTIVSLPLADIQAYLNQ